MPDYTHLLETKLTTDQKQALNLVTDIARAHKMTVYLTGGAIRDIVSGSSVRDLDVSVQGNALKLLKDLEKAGFELTGEYEPSQTLFLRYHQRARIEVSSTRTEHFSKPGKPEYKPAGILDDLRRRDFTANAMALSLNEGSYGLMLDPLNGTADIQSQQLRLVDNYGFLNDPIRMVRAIRFLARTGWVMEERTRTRYDNAKAEDVISHTTAHQRGYELEEIAYEEDALVILKALEAEGWMKHLFPAWTHHSADPAGLQKLHEKQVQLLMAGLHPEVAAAAFTQLTAKMSPANFSALKRLFSRKGMVHDIAALDHDAKEFSKHLLSKEAAKPSQAWKLFHSAKPEGILWLFFTGKGAPIQSRFESFFTKWTEARQKIPYAILQEMRIKPDLENYAEVQDKMTFAFMDGELPSEEAIRKFLEPFSPPAPPPPVIIRRPRAVKRVVAPKVKKKSAKVLKAEAAAAAAAALGTVAAEAAATPAVADAKTKAAPAKKAETKPDAKAAVAARTIKGASAKPAAKVPAKPAAKSVVKPAAKSASKPAAKPAAKTAPKKAAPKKPAPKAAKPAAAKSTKKPAAKSTAKSAPAKKKPAGKKVVAKNAVPKKKLSRKSSSQPKGKPKLKSR
ncbi:MAG TPA: CCA tRNA nucleotidyltransferase [Acidobacteriaceae bacterium]|jgi:tRNA nucleotidyltransferase/poly(A) polymerase|nr:CCA tRNA nucleotidyltransferase [Acidobacteriaceae bacterium]